MNRFLFLARLWGAVDELILIWSRLSSYRSFLDDLAQRLELAESTQQDVPFILQAKQIPPALSVVHALQRILKRFPG